jgi:hypothetical protein
MSEDKIDLDMEKTDFNKLIDLLMERYVVIKNPKINYIENALKILLSQFKEANEDVNGIKSSLNSDMFFNDLYQTTQIDIKTRSIIPMHETLLKYRNAISDSIITFHEVLKILLEKELDRTDIDNDFRSSINVRLEGVNTTLELSKLAGINNNNPIMN